MLKTLHLTYSKRMAFLLFQPVTLPSLQCFRNILVRISVILCYAEQSTKSTKPWPTWSLCAEQLWVCKFTNTFFFYPCKTYKVNARELSKWSSNPWLIPSSIYVHSRFMITTTVFFHVWWLEIIRICNHQFDSIVKTLSKLLWVFFFSFHFLLKFFQWQATL